VPDAVQAEIDRLAPQRIVLLGGTASLTDAVGALTTCSSLTTQTTVIATGLEVPWDVAFVGTDAYLTQRKSGKVLRRAADGRITTVQTLPSVDYGEGGLLGLTARDGVLYAYLTTSTDNRIVRFRPGEAPTPILTGIARGTNHDAGRIAFGPDGMLYAGTGDAGVSSRAQDPASLNGKILRMTPDGKVPADNPRPGSLVYALGLRDPQGLAWDGAGRLFATEFGPDRDDEVNRIVANGNYGWPTATGQARDPRFVDPLVVRQTGVASWSGAAIVKGGVPEWDGDLLVAALRGTRLYRFDLDANGNVIGTGEELYTGTYGRLRQVKQAPDGSLWVLTSNRDGRGAPVAADDRIIRIGRPA
jgi:glucose/arabinose dehydrogenase